MNKFSICTAGLLAISLLFACEKPVEKEEKVISIPSKEEINKVKEDVNSMAEKTEAAAREAGEAAKEGAEEAMQQMENMVQPGE